MWIATGTFDPYGVTTLREVVRHIGEFSEADEIYVADVARVGPETPAVVTSDQYTAADARNELSFRFLSAVDDAREMIDAVPVRNEEDLQRLIDSIEEWGA